MESQPGTVVLNGEVALRLFAWKERKKLNLEFAPFSQACSAAGWLQMFGSRGTPRINGKWPEKNPSV